MLRLSTLGQRVRPQPPAESPPDEGISAHQHRYRVEVLEILAGHGVRPAPTTPPPLVREYLSGLYRWEIRRLRDRLRHGAFPKHEYIDRVVALRRRYVLLSVPVDAWIDTSAPSAVREADGGA
jgi:hypothetical protein